MITDRRQEQQRRSGKLRVAVVTGTRAEFGLLEPVLRAMHRRKRLDPRLIVTGMHLLPQFGRTVDQIRAAGWRVAATVRMQSGRGAREEPEALARGISGMARAIDRLDCPVVLVLGDRIEAFAAACAATTARRVLCHIHGGDRALGELDDVYRDAISRMAHVHLAASQDAVLRLRRMGEEPWRIHLVGAPGLDDIRAFRAQWNQRARRTNRRLQELIGPLARRSYAVVIQHPIGRSDAAEAATMQRVLDAVEAASLAGVIIFPNSDAGHKGIVREIGRWQKHGQWLVFRSLPRQDYLLLASHAAVVVGNSSSGIIESASLGVPAVNIGPRQEGRLRCGPSVVDVPDRSQAIRRAVANAARATRPAPSRSVYGDGNAGKRIADILGRLRLGDRLIRKRPMF
ncbi:MAG: UDP-N-acetylglucosamine 2-epimerase [Phycisphaerae bacterium]